jgi:talin
LTIFGQAELVFKKKHQPMKIKLLDGTVKTVLIDWSLPVSELADVIGNKLNISNPEEYSLIKENEQGCS